MPRRLPPPVGKQRTREHVLADLSVNHVERFALRCGFAVQRLTPDYGLDLAVFTLDEHGFRESGFFWIQLKATDHLKKSRDGTTVQVRIERRDILAWIGERHPVFLVLFDAVRERGYYLSIPGYFGGPEKFARLGAETVTIKIPVENIIGENAMREFAGAARALCLPKGDQQ